jgi:hypothetical protein
LIAAASSVDIAVMGAVRYNDSANLDAWPFDGTPQLDQMLTSAADRASRSVTDARGARCAVVPMTARLLLDGRVRVAIQAASTETL